jgi:hypothetical protein
MCLNPIMIALQQLVLQLFVQPILLLPGHVQVLRKVPGFCQAILVRLFDALHCIVSEVFGCR